MGQFLTHYPTLVPRYGQTVGLSFKLALLGVEGQCVDHAQPLAPTRAERDAVVDLLRDAVGRGILTLDEFEVRLDQAYCVQTLNELEDLVRWVPPPDVHLDPARTRRRLRIVAAGVAAIVICGGAAVTIHRVNDPPPQAPALASSALQPTVDRPVNIPATCNGVVGYESTQTAWLNQQYELLLPTAGRVSGCVAAAGLDERPAVGGRETYIHVDLLLMGGTVAVPAGIGTGANGETAAMYTISDDGIVHIRSDAPTGLTLGQLFQEWGHPISPYGVGSLRMLASTPITWYINGAAIVDPRSALIHNHDEVWAFQDSKNAPVNPTTSFDWPAGF